MPMADTAMTREVLRDIGKHPVDISDLHVLVQHGVIYLTGRLGKLRGYYEDRDLQEELLMIVRILRQKPGIRDVCCDVQLGESSLKERLNPQVKRNT